MTLEQALTGLQSPDPKARVRAVRWLRVLVGPWAVAALIGAPKDGPPDVQQAAVEALGAMRAPEAVPVLMARFQSDRSVSERAAAIRALVDGRDPRAVPPLIEALGAPEEWVVETACEALGALRATSQSGRSWRKRTASPSRSRSRP